MSVQIDLSSDVAVVTGGGSGIGAGIATLLAEAGARVAILDMSAEAAKTVAEQIRHLLVQVLARNGGHLAPNLGTVELTLALHHLFDSPKDRIVWDVGHQAYVHKILTGRRDRLPTIRQEGGLSGYCRLVESEHDAFGAGHGCTSISAALGYAVARDHKGTDEHVIAVIGDGSLTERK